MKHFFKPTLSLLIGAMSFMVSSCGDDNDKDSVIPDEPSTSAIVGKWQKYGRVEADGSLSGGDPDEYWIFNSDGSFINEDSGEITTSGTYSIEGNKLTIMSRQVDGDFEEENLTGTFKIEGKYMDYNFTEIGDDDYTTYRFLKQ